MLGVAGILVAAFQWGLPWEMREGDRNHVYTGNAGSLRYQVHRPPRHDGRARLPVVMALHGCGMTGYGWNSMKATTQLNDLVVQDYGAEPDRVHVAGASSGAGTAVILAATYPDIFATATSVAGGEYGLNQVDPEDLKSTPPDYTARQAWAGMGDRARFVPLLVIQGDADPVVPPLVATRLVEQWTAVGDLVDDGLLNDSLELRSTATRIPAAPGRHAYAHQTLTDPDGTSLAELYLVQGMEHVWPGPNGDGAYTDRAGPDATALAWGFAERHPKR